MIKVRDGYGKLIGSDYNGNIAHVLLSNGGNLQYAVGSTASTLVLRNASGQIESSVASTVAPFVISSTKVNANLNADLLDGFLATGLFQSLTSAADKNLYIKIGNTEKEVPLLYASYLGGVTKEGLFTELTNVNDSTNPNSIKVTIGDTTKYLRVGYADNAASASKVGKKLIIKANSGTTENTNLYTFDGSADKTINMIAGSNITITPTANTLTIASSYVNTTYTLSGAYGTSNKTYVVTLTPSSGPATTATIPTMVGATSSAAGKEGLVPLPATGDRSKFLRGDGVWTTISIPNVSITNSGSGNAIASLSASGHTITATKGYFLPITLISANTNVADLKDTTLYYTDTDSNTATLTNGPSTNSFAMLLLKGYESGNDLRRYRLALDGYGAARLFNDRSTDGTGGTWYDVLTNNNSSVTGDGGSTWGSSITVKINNVSKTLTIPANPNVDTKVTLTNTTGSANYRVLFSANANDTTETTTARKSGKLLFNPSTGDLTATLFVGNLKGNINPFTNLSYTPGTSTVKNIKDALVTAFTNINAGIGANVVVPAYAINYWSTESTVILSSNVYSMIKIGGGYSGTTYGLWLLSTYASNRIGYVGRDGNAWGSVYWLATTTDIDTLKGYYWANVKISATSSTTTTPTFGGVTVNGGMNAIAIKHTHTLSTAWNDFIRCLSPNLTTTNHTAHITFGRTYDSKNVGYIGFKYAGNASNSNMVTIGLHSVDNVLNVLASGNVGIGTTSPSSKLHVSGGTLKITNNSNTMTIGSQNTSWGHIENSANINFYFNRSIHVDGAIWRYNTNYGIDSDGKFYAHTVYANLSGSSTAGGVSLYSNSDPMTYGIAFRTTANYGTHGWVTGDWATYLTMSNTTNRGWIFRTSDGTRCLSINTSGSLYANGAGFFGSNVSAANSGWSNPGDAAFEAREYARAGTNTSTAPHSLMYAPRVGFHWGNRYWGNIIFYDNAFRFMNNNASSYVNIYAANLYGTVSNITVNDSNANSTYRMVWHSGNTLYSTNNIYCNPSADQIYSAGFRHVSYNSASYLLRSDGGAAAFNWSGQSGQPTWLWGGNSQHTYYVYNPSNFNVWSAAVLRGNASNPDNSHPGHGAKVFYSWNTGQVGNASSGYSNGITIGSHPSDTAYGFQIVQNMWDDRTYTRRYNGGWLSWKTLAWTSDIPSVGNGTVTIKQAGTTKGSFTMNQSGNTTIELTDNNTTYSFAAKGSSTQGIYLAGTNTFATMTYSLKATVNSGTSNKLAYYSGANAISAYTSTCGDYYKPIYLSGGVPIECYSRSIGSVTWGTNCSGYIQVKLFGPIVILQGYFTKINVNQTSSTNYVFKLPTGTPSPATTVGITLSLDDGYENDRNTIIMIRGQYGYCNTGYNSFNPNGWTYYFSACYMA